MPFLLAEILNFQGSTHHIGVGSFSHLLSIPFQIFNAQISSKTNIGSKPFKQIISQTVYGGNMHLGLLL